MPESGSTTVKVLPYQKNCVGMALSKILKLGILDTIRHLKGLNLITDGDALEFPERGIEVAKGLKMPRVCENESWSSVKGTLKTDGRYFAVNWTTSAEDHGDRPGHAFAIVIKHGSLGVAGNNSEKKDETYLSQIRGHHKVTIYGPYPKAKG